MLCSLLMDDTSFRVVDGMLVANIFEVSTAILVTREDDTSGKESMDGQSQAFCFISSSACSALGE